MNPLVHLRDRAETAEDHAIKLQKAMEWVHREISAKWVVGKEDFTKMMVELGLYRSNPSGWVLDWPPNTERKPK